MLAYKIIRHLADRWKTLNKTVEEGVDELTQLCAARVAIANGVPYNTIPTPRATTAELLKLAEVTMPRALPHSGTIVSTRKKLAERRRMACYPRP